jgi:hypothetical protein
MPGVMMWSDFATTTALMKFERPWGEFSHIKVLLFYCFTTCAILIIMQTVPLVITRVMTATGARGVLLGVVLGTLTTGLRNLFCADRPYTGNK